MRHRTVRINVRYWEWGNKTRTSQFTWSGSSLVHIILPIETRSSQLTWSVSSLIHIILISYRVLLNVLINFLMTSRYCHISYNTIYFLFNSLLAIICSGSLDLTVYQLRRASFLPTLIRPPPSPQKDTTHWIQKLCLCILVSVRKRITLASMFFVQLGCTGHPVCKLPAFSLHFNTQLPVVI